MRILIVDDNPQVLLNLRLFLLDYFPEAEIFIASNEPEAMEVTNQYKPDIFLVDFRLKEAKGTFLISKLKKVNPNGHYAIISVSPKPDFVPEEFERWFIKGSDLSEIISYIGSFQKSYFK